METRTNLLEFLSLSCGCRKLRGLVYFEIGQQVLEGKPIICPTHNREHQFSHNIDILKVAAGLLAAQTNFGDGNELHLKIDDEPCSIRVCEF